MNLEDLIGTMNSFARNAAVIATVGLVTLGGCERAETPKLRYKSVKIDEIAKAPQKFSGNRVTFLGKPINIQRHEFYNDQYNNYGVSLDLTLLSPKEERVHCYFFRDSQFDTLKQEQYENFMRIAGRLNDRIEENANIRIGGMVDSRGYIELKWADFGSGKREYLVQEQPKTIETKVVEGYCSDVIKAVKDEGFSSQDSMTALSLKANEKDKKPEFFVYFDEEKNYSNFKGKKVRIQVEGEGEKGLLYKGISIREVK